MAASCATPVLIRRVEDSDGAVLYKEEDKSHRAVSEATAFLMASMLSDVINAGTAFRARQNGFTLPAAGKTGTTNDYNDAWFVGFTPHLVTGVWVGFDQPQTIASGGYAGELAVPIWAAFMKRATRGDKPDWFERPANVVGVNVCRVSGKLPTGGCDNVPVVNRDGASKSARWSTPSTSCAARSPTRCARCTRPSFTERLAGIFGKDVGDPVSADAVGCRPPREHVRQPGAHHGRASAAARTDDKVEEPKKKRGFWGRIFGRGDEEKREKEGRRGAEEGRGAEESGTAARWPVKCGSGDRIRAHSTCRFVTSSVIGTCSDSWPPRRRGHRCRRA